MDFDYILRRIENISDDEKRRRIILEVNISFLNILYRPGYNEEQLKILREYVTKGMYEKSIAEGITDPNIRKVILAIRSLYCSGIASEIYGLDIIYEEKNMFETLLSHFSRVLLNKRNFQRLDVKNHDLMLKDLLKDVIYCGLGDTFKYVNLLRERMSLEEFEHSATFNILSINLGEIAYVNDDKLKKVILDNYYQFAKEYIADSVKNNNEIDFENNIFFKNFPKEQRDKLKGYYISINLRDNSFPNSIDDLNCANAYVSDLLEKAYNDYPLTIEDKNIIARYFDFFIGFYDDTMTNYSKLEPSYVNKTLEYMIKISIFGLDDYYDTRFITSLYEGNLIEDLVEQVEKTDASEEYPLIFLIRVTTDEVDLVKRYLNSLEQKR